MSDAYYDLAVTTGRPETLNALHSFGRELVSHGSGASAIIQAAEQDPDAPLANAYAAALYLTLMTREGQARAARPLALALSRLKACNPREQQTIAAITAWQTGDERMAARILQGMIEIWPHDLVAMKLCQILQTGVGDMHGMLRSSAMAVSVEGRSGHALGLHAFALEQADEPELAMRFARRAIDLNPGFDPWAEHVVAHVFAATGQPVEGRAFLHAHSAGWERCSSFMLTHNWWHLALVELELDNLHAAFDLLVERIWAVRKGHSQDQINAISLLARMEMDGLVAPDIWEDIAVHIEDRAQDNMNAFLDLHYLYALTKAGRDGAVRTMLDRFDPLTMAGALAHGVAAYAKREYMLAASMIGPFHRDLSGIGGSNVQRQLFELFFVDSVNRCRRLQAEPSVMLDVAA